MLTPGAYDPRFMKPATPAACWNYTGTLNGAGYGTQWINGKVWLVHRYMWTVMRGPIPEGMELDHLCRNPRCVNPQHLEVVTHKENCARGVGWSGRHTRATHCPRGHAYDAANTYLGHRPSGAAYRRCRACDNEQHKARRQA